MAKFGHERLMVGLAVTRRFTATPGGSGGGGNLGQIVSIEASEHIEPYHGAHARLAPHERYSGSFMLEKCCHDLDLYNGIVGARPERVASFADARASRLDNDPAREGINDLELFHRKPSGWKGTDKVFDSDAEHHRLSGRGIGRIRQRRRHELPQLISTYPTSSAALRSWDRAAWPKAISFAAIWTQASN